MRGSPYPLNFAASNATPFAPDVLLKATGGGFDTYSRTIARQMGKHIPGKPTVVVENMTGVLESLPVRSLIHLFKPNPNAFPLFKPNPMHPLASTLGEIARPICLAVLRLITSSNFVGRSTGSSAGLAP